MKDDLNQRGSQWKKIRIENDNNKKKTFFHVSEHVDHFKASKKKIKKNGK